MLKEAICLRALIPPQYIALSHELAGNKENLLLRKIIVLLVLWWLRFNAAEGRVAVVFSGRIIITSDLQGLEMLRHGRDLH